VTKSQVTYNVTWLFLLEDMHMSKKSMLEMLNRERETADIEGRDRSLAKLPPYAWPGGYAIEYITIENNVLCADCATDDVIERERHPMPYNHNMNDECRDCEYPYGDHYTSHDGATKGCSIRYSNCYGFACKGCPDEYESNDYVDSWGTLEEGPRVLCDDCGNVIYEGDGEEDNNV
jgi:hypothetical protein